MGIKNTRSRRGGRSVDAPVEPPRQAGRGAEATGAAPSPPSRWRRYRPALGLLVLAPWTGEYLLGNVPASSLLLLPFLVPLYGGGALLIREVVRRTGRGWRAILLLAAAYGVIEAGLVDQALFNPDLDGATDRLTEIPFIGIDAMDTMSFVVGHVVWSIAIPIAIVEMLTPQRPATPWLGFKGLLATAALYLLGCLIVFQDMLTSEGFLASGWQRVGVLVVAVALVLAAFRVKERRVVPDDDRRVPAPWPLGVMAFVVSGAFFARPEDWLWGVAGGFAILVAAGTALSHWSARPSWSVRQSFALAAGTLLTYAWGGFVLVQLTVPDDTIALVGNVAFAGVAVALLLATSRALLRREAPTTSL